MAQPNIELLDLTKATLANMLFATKIGSIDNCLTASAIANLSFYSLYRDDTAILKQAIEDIDNLIKINSHLYRKNDDLKTNHPEHYNQGALETITYLNELGIVVDFCLGNAIKYLSRYKFKSDPIGDLEKAKWYVNYLIEYYER